MSCLTLLSALKLHVGQFIVFVKPDLVTLPCCTLEARSCIAGLHQSVAMELQQHKVHSVHAARFSTLLVQCSNSNTTSCDRADVIWQFKVRWYSPEEK